MEGAAPGADGVQENETRRWGEAGVVEGNQHFNYMKAIVVFFLS